MRETKVEIQEKQEQLRRDLNAEVNGISDSDEGESSCSEESFGK